MLRISRSALREGCDRAADLFLLSRLQEPGASAETFSAVFAALGLDAEMRRQLERALVDLVPVQGVPSLEAAMATSMLGGVLVGWLIAASALPEDELELPAVSS
jgi:protein-disulfide isomerase-like protein with CxxC motif